MKSHNNYKLKANFHVSDIYGVKEMNKIIDKRWSRRGVPAAATAIQQGTEKIHFK